MDLRRPSAPALKSRLPPKILVPGKEGVKALLSKIHGRLPDVVTASQDLRALRSLMELQLSKAKTLLSRLPPSYLNEHLALSTTLTGTTPQNRKNEIQNELKMKTQPWNHNNQAPVNRATRFAFSAPNARQVWLAGDFNNWDTKAGPMQKGRDGEWYLALPLKPGRYEYRFFADGTWHDDPAATQRTANSMGTQNCVRVV